MYLLMSVTNTSMHLMNIILITTVKTWNSTLATTATKGSLFSGLLRAQEREPKKLVAVSATSASVTGASMEAVLQRVPCIRYPVQFQQGNVQALLDSGSKVNAMTPAYATKLGLTTRKTDVGAQKIDRSTLVTYWMVIAGFSVQDKLGKVRLFEETFLLADTSMEVVLGMPFLTLPDADIRLEWRRYTTAEALPTTQRVELIDKKEFAVAALNENDETFVVHVVTLASKMPIYPSREAQIGLLLTDEAPIEVPSEYSDYADVFLFDLAMELPENTGMNEHAIELSFVTL